MTAGVGVNWLPRSEPLAPCACVARGRSRPRARKRPARVGAGAPRPDQGVRRRRRLVVLGDVAELPWLDGIAYLGRDEAAPHLLLPTSRRPDVPLDLFARALAARVPGCPGGGAVLPEPTGGMLWVPIAAAGPIERASLEAWMASP